MSSQNGRFPTADSSINTKNTPNTRIIRRLPIPARGTRKTIFRRQDQQSYCGVGERGKRERGREVTHRKRSRRWPPGTRRRWLGIQIQDWFFRRARGRCGVVDEQELSERGRKSGDGGQREGARPAPATVGPAPATRRGFWKLENLFIRRVLVKLTSRSCDSI